MAIERKELQAINDLLTHAYREGADWIRNVQPEHPHLSNLLPNFPRFPNRDDMQAKLPRTLDGRGSFGSQYIYVAAPTKHKKAVFFISIAWNFVEIPTLSLYLHMFRSANIQGQELGFVGYRFESPSDGNHNYWHAQPIIKSGRNREIEIPESIPWLFTDIPAFPLSVKDLPGLCCAALLSIYGVSRMRTLAATIENNRVRQSISQLLG